MKLEKSPYTEGTLTYDFTFEGNPISHTAGWKEDRLISVSPIERALSTPDGSIEVTRVDIVVNDTDGTLRALLTDEETEYWDGREVDICLASDDLLETDPENPWILFRGRIEGLPRIQDELQISFTLIDVIGSEFSAVNYEKDLSIPIGDEWENRPEGLIAYYNQVIGEHNDVGAMAASGTLVDKGLIPGTYVGMYDVSGDEPDPTPPPVIPPPTNLRSDVNGGDDAENFYAGSVITPFGESRISDVLKVSGCPRESNLDQSHDVRLSGDFDAGPGRENRVRIWGRHNNPPTHWLDSAFYEYGAGETQPDKWYYNDGSHPAPNPSRTDVDRMKKMTLPNGDAISPAADTYWGFVVVGIGEIPIHGTPYASNLAVEDTPVREAMDPSLEGVEYILPTSPQWPFPDPWIERANSDGEVFRVTVVLMRGARLQHHIDGVCTIAFNVCGYKGTNGLTVTQAFYQLQLYLNEFVFKDFGKGYRRGDMHTLETFLDGKPLLWTRKFREAQETSMLLTSDTVGFEGAWCINEPITLREFIRRFCVSFGCLFGHNHFGQSFPVLPTTTVPLTEGRLYRYPYDLERVPVAEPHPEFRKNIIFFDFDWDTDLGQFRFVDYDAQHDDSQLKHGMQGQRRKIGDPNPVGLYCTRHLVTATAAMGNFLTMYRKTPHHYVAEPLDLTALHDELGDRVRLLHWNTVSPAATRQILVLRHRIDVTPGQESVTLVGMDMNRVA